MNVQKRNDVSIYCLSSGSSMPEWLGERGRRNLAKSDESIRRRIELIQDFSMPASSSKIVQSMDGQYIIAAGTYPPRIRCYDVHELTMKFERYLTAEVVDIVLLGENYGKIAMLLDDRTVALHAPYGAHDSFRIPTFGRALAYEATTCDLLIGAKGNLVYRFNLELGRFAEPWSLDADGVSSTCIAVNDSYPLVSVGCDDGVVRMWDTRLSSTPTLKPLVKLDVAAAVVGYGYADEHLKCPYEVTCLAYDSSGMFLAVGIKAGVIALYDVRSSKPLFIMEHKHGLPIHTIRFHSGSGMVISADEKIVKFWRYKSIARTSEETSFLASDANKAFDSSIGAVRVNVEGSGRLKHFIMAGDESDPHGDKSGLLLCASEQSKMESFFIPAIGLAPKWCSFLESITEELEERDLQRGASDLVRDGQESVFENYKFVSRDDIDKLGIANLIGTPLLRGYMHGFFMDINLYNRVKAVANPFEYEEYQKKKVKERLEAKRSSRIVVRAATKAKTTVNPELADRLQHKAGDTSKAGKIANTLLQDKRFGSLFQNPDFAIDEDDDNFKLRNPSGIAAAKRKKDNLDSDDEIDESSANAFDHRDADNALDEHSVVKDEDAEVDESESDSDDDGFDGVKVRGEDYEAIKALDRKPANKISRAQSAPKTTKRKSAATVLVADDLSGTAVQLALGEKNVINQARERKEELNLPMAKRLMHQDQQRDNPIGRQSLLDVTDNGGGNKQMSYVPRKSKRELEKAAKERDETLRGKRNRRGVKD